MLATLTTKHASPANWSNDTESPSSDSMVRSWKADMGASLCQPSAVADELSDEQLHDAAAGDLNVLAVLMLVGSAGFALINKWIGTMGWLAVVLTVTSTLSWSIGLLRRNRVIAAFVKIGFGFSGLTAPVVGIAGVVFGILGYRWGWAVLAGAAVYFAFSVLGLEIIERAEETGVLEGV